MYGAEALSGSQYQMMNSGTSSLIDLNDSSNSQGNPDPMYRSSMKKKPIRDPYAHRRVEKTRRDRMNFSLNRLCSLIPENFRNQVNQGNTRVDKIKIVDIAILYVEHLHELIGQYSSMAETRKQSKETHESKKDVETSTSDLVQINTVANDTNLSYIKGFFNGTLEYLSYLIENTVLTNINKIGQVVQSDKMSIIFNIELYVNLLRKFHAVYFNKMKLSTDSIKSVIESNVAGEDSDGAKRPLSFPFNNRKLIKKILFILSLYSDQKRTNFIKYYKKIYEYVLDSSVRNDKSNVTNSQSSEPAQFSLPCSESSSRSSSISTNSENSSDSDMSDSETRCKKLKNAQVESSAPTTSSKLVETQPQFSTKQTAKKLKSNLIERFSSTSASTEDPLVTDQSSSKDKSKQDANTDNKDDMVSIFILHSSHDFYLSGCLDKSLLDSDLLKNVIKNPEFRPRSVQKIKLDVVFGADIVIKKDNDMQTLSQYECLFSNKRKNRDLVTFLHPSLRKFNHNLVDENRILEPYLRHIRKCHENKKKQLNGSKYDNLTILYKNYSRSANMDNDDQMSEKTFYTV